MAQHWSGRFSDKDAFEALFEPLRSAEPPREEFLAELHQALADEFSGLHPDKSATVNSPASRAASDHDARRRPAAISINRRRRSRWLIGAVNAATILVVMSWMWGSTDYGWARMIEAMENSDWVEVVAAEDGRPARKVWWSGRRRIFAVSSDGHAAFEDSRGSSRLLHSKGRSVIVTKPTKQQQAEGSASRLIATLARMALAEEAVKIDGSADYLLLSESWSRNSDGEIELSVELQVGDREQDRLAVTFVLDPDTALPIRAYTKPAGRRESETLLFNFTEEGPENIYSLGVSRDLPVVDQHELVAGIDADLVAASAESLPAEEPDAAFEEEVDSERPPTLTITQMGERIDLLLREHWAEEAIEPVQRSSDEEFVRRVYLDLTGRIPTVPEVASFLRDDRPDRRLQLLDGLLTQFDHASHLASVWRSCLIPDPKDLTSEQVESFEQWLTDRFQRNTPYDELVSELLLAEGRIKQAGPLVFFAAQKLQPEEIARQTSRVFLGVRLDCAQCHDDFFDDRWSQRDFWEYAAFFAQMSSLESRVDRVSPVLQVKDMPRGEVTLPDESEFIGPQFPLSDRGAGGDDGVSRRQRLVQWLLDPGNPHFAKATVNRVWAQLFGRGIVHPVDDFRPDNSPVAPELLDELADYFVATGFDLRRLIAAIVRSEAYQLSSSAARGGDKRLRHFGQMNVKCFSAEQLYDCVVVATKVQVGGRQPAFGAALNRRGNFDRVAFIQQFQAPGGERTEYGAGIAQALTLMNGSLTESATANESSGLLRSLQAPFFSDEQRVDTLFLATVSRYPTPAEREAVLGFLSEASSPDQKSAALSDALWALINSAEFTLIP